MEWLSDLQKQIDGTIEEQRAYTERFSDECSIIVKNCPNFLSRLEEMIMEQDTKIDEKTGDDLYKAIGARAQIKDILGNIRLYAQWRPDKEQE